MIIIKNSKPVYIDYDFDTEAKKIIKEYIINEYRKEFYKQNFQN